MRDEAKLIWFVVNPAAVAVMFVVLRKGEATESHNTKHSVNSNTQLMKISAS